MVALPPHPALGAPQHPAGVPGPEAAAPGEAYHSIRSLPQEPTTAPGAGPRSRPQEPTTAPTAAQCRAAQIENLLSQLTALQQAEAAQAPYPQDQPKEESWATSQGAESAWTWPQSRYKKGKGKSGGSRSHGKKVGREQHKGEP